MEHLGNFDLSLSHWIWVSIMGFYLMGCMTCTNTFSIFYLFTVYLLYFLLKMYEICAEKCSS